MKVNREEKNMYKGIVLDKMQTNAFLAIAANEKLICENGMTDGVFERRTRHMPSKWFAEMILEQFTVAGAVYVDPHTYRCLDGELIEKRIIMPYTECEDDLPGFLTFDIDTVQWMMAEKGLDINFYTTDRIRAIFTKWKEMAQELSELEKEYNLDYKVVSFQKIVGLAPRMDYSGIDIDHFLKLGNYVYHHNPVLDVLKEYKELFNTAYYNDLLSPVVNVTNPDNANSSNPDVIIPVTEGTQAIKILKFTSEKLNRIYTAATLRDNVKLVQTDAAKAYRNKVNEWMTAFSAQNYDNMQIIERDIVKAQNAMKSKKHIERAGKICATIGVIATLASHINPSWIPVAAVGTGAATVAEIATYLGAPTAFLNPGKRHLWASFGMFSG